MAGPDGESVANARSECAQHGQERAQCHQHAAGVPKVSLTPLVGENADDLDSDTDGAGNATISPDASAKAGSAEERRGHEACRNSGTVADLPYQPISADEQSSVCCYCEGVVFYCYVSGLNGRGPIPFAT